MIIIETGVYKMTQDQRIRENAISTSLMPKNMEFLVTQIDAGNRKFYSPATGWQFQDFPARRLGPGRGDGQ